MNKNDHAHTISLLVSNKPGVLVRVALVFARRGYNIESLVVSPSADQHFSRMTITAKGDPVILDQIIKQTVKLVDVIHSSEHSEDDALHRELALFKIKNLPANRAVLPRLVKQYKAEVIFSDETTLIIQQAGTTEELDQLEGLLRKYNLIEMVRSGKLVVVKGTRET